MADLLQEYMRLASQGNPLNWIATNANAQPGAWQSGQGAPANNAIMQAYQAALRQGFSPDAAISRAAQQTGAQPQAVAQAVGGALMGQQPPSTVRASDWESPQAAAQALMNPGGAWWLNTPSRGAWLQGPQDARRYGGAPTSNPAASRLVGQQNQRRYGGAPFAAGQGRSVPRWTSEAQMRAAAGQGRPMPAASAADPNAWANNPLWQYQQGGPGPFAGVPYEAWPDAMDQLGAALPWAQMQQYAQRDALGASQWDRTFGAQQGQQAWDNSRAQGNDAFQQWLAGQQLTLQQQAAQQGQQQQGVDNSWRWAQLGLQGRQVDMDGQRMAFEQDMQQRGFTAQQAQQAWNNQMADRQQGWQEQRALVGDSQWRDQFNANRADTAWTQGFQLQDWNRAGQQWEQSFGAQRDDALWNRNWATDRARVGDDQWGKTFGEDTRRFDLTNAQQQALTQWNQAFSQSQFDWNKQMDTDRNRLQEEGQYLAAFGRKTSPAIGSM